MEALICCHFFVAEHCLISVIADSDLFVQTTNEGSETRPTITPSTVSVPAYEYAFELKSQRCASQSPVTAPSQAKRGQYNAQVLDSKTLNSYLFRYLPTAYSFVSNSSIFVLLNTYLYLARPCSISTTLLLASFIGLSSIQGCT